MSVFEWIHGPSLHEPGSTVVPGLSPLQSRIYLNHLPEESLERIFSPDVSFLHSPFYLPDLDAATRKINQALLSSSHIMLYGDRDSDGVIATAILGMELEKINEETQAKITIKTTSEDDDYGLCPRCIDSILAIQPDLLITIDFGSSNFTEINRLKNEGIDVIVLDHHEIPERIPDCLLINPKRKDSSYPFKNICSAVLSFKLVEALHFFRTSEYNKNYWIFTNEESKDGILIKNGTILFSGSLEKSKELFPEGYYHYPPGLEKDRPDDRIFHYQLTRKTSILKQISEYLSLAAIGTITDLMLLNGENRVIVHNGLREMENLFKKQEISIVGLKNLLDQLGVNKNKISSKDLGWLAGPAINAAGRMGKSELALDLLLEKTNREAETKAKELIQINQERKERTKRNIDRAEKILNEADTSHPVIFCYSPDMEPGVSGIVATKLVNQFGKPAIFISQEKEYAKGSARASQNENILTLVSKLEKHLIQFGGHQEAAGFSLRTENIDTFKEDLIRVSYEWANEIKETPPIHSIATLLPHELNTALYKDISLLEPYGQGNPHPFFSMKNVKILNFKPMGNGEHASFKVQGCDIRFVIWNKATELEEKISSSETISIWGNLEENFFRSRSTIQFTITHFR